jgi:sugar lactone lactonase YvrE
VARGFETLASGYRLVEAPRADGEGGVLFSDVVGGGVHRWTPSGVSVVLPRRRGIGGLVLHTGGGVLVSGRDLALDGRTVVPAPAGVTGFNDLVTDDDGSVLVGAMRFRPMMGEPAAPGEVWRVVPGGGLSLFAPDVLWPNGIGISPAADVVYVSNYTASEVLAFDADGGNRRVFVEPSSGQPDGLAVDVEGCVWVALGEGGAICRYTPEGEVERTLELPGQFVASLSFDGEALLVATAGALLRTEVGVAGRRVPHAAIAA